MSNHQEIELSDLKATEALARAVSKCLSSGDMIGLCGELGAGKTTFVKFLSKELGVKDDVTSPTFVLEHEYSGSKFVLSHWDIYRLAAAPNELWEHLQSDRSKGKGIVTVVEWIDKDPTLMSKSQLIINFSLSAFITTTNTLESDSLIRLVCLTGDKAEAVLQELRI